MAPVSKPKADLGEHFLREWRDHREIGQQQAADAINVSRTLLSKIENSQSPYLQPQIEGLANLYRCKPADLLGTDPTKPEQTAEGRLRSALLGFGVDASDLGRAVLAVRVFVDDPVERSSPSLPDDRPEPANSRRAKAPSPR